MHVIVQGRLMESDGQPAAGRRLVAQRYRLRTARWVRLAAAASDDEGRFKLGARHVTGDSAPLIRLVEPGESQRVLGVGGAVRFDSRQDRLYIDMGTIERLGDEAFRHQPVEEAFAERDRYLVAGALNPPDRPVMHRDMLHAANLGVSLAQPTLDLGAAVGEAGASGDAGRPRPSEFDTRMVAELNLVANRHLAELSQKAQLRELALQRELDAREQALTARERQLASLRSELTDLDDQRRRTAERLERAQRDLALLKEQTEREVAAGDLYATVADQLQRTRRRLEDEAGGYRLGNVSLSLRAVMAGDGSRLFMPDSQTLGRIGSDRLARLDLQLWPDEGDPPASAIEVPDFGELTESAARRLAGAVGLELEAAYRTADVASVPAGQAQQQAPAPGAQVPPGSVVLVVFAEG